MRRISLTYALGGFLIGVAGTGQLAAQTPLADARKDFKTTLIIKERDGTPAPRPPKGVFDLVKYRSPVGQLAAYLSSDPQDGKKHPLIIWITGGFANSIDDLAWKPGPAADDQSATAFREAGILMMYPSLRGGNDNPGSVENFYGEVNDVLAARDWAAAQPYVDPARIYLGGHSTGGTLALLTSEYADGWRAVFCFGPVYGPRGYREAQLYFDLNNPKEIELRAPNRWLDGVKSPTFAFEGLEEPSNHVGLEAMAKANKNPLVHFFPVAGVSHFSILQPVNHLLAQKIVADNGPAANITLTDAEIAAAVAPGVQPK